MEDLHNIWIVALVHARGDLTRLEEQSYHNFFFLFFLTFFQNNYPCWNFFCIFLRLQNVFLCSLTSHLIYTLVNTHQTIHDEINDFFPFDYGPSRRSFLFGFFSAAGGQYSPGYCGKDFIRIRLFHEGRCSVCVPGEGGTSVLYTRGLMALFPRSCPTLSGSSGRRSKPPGKHTILYPATWEGGLTEAGDR